LSTIDHSFTFVMNKTPKATFHYIAFMKTIEKLSHVTSFVKKTKKTKSNFLQKRTFVTWKFTTSSSMCKMNPNLKSEMKTYLCYCSPSSIYIYIYIYQGYEFEFLLNTHSLFSSCDIIVIHVWFLFTNGSKGKGGYPKK
jgi:hypothetical protein